MRDKESITYRPGRLIISRIASKSDLIASLIAICDTHAIQNGLFSASGSLISATIGVFDRIQGVYVTHLEELATELLSCRGSFSVKKERPRVRAEVILADQQGQLTGGLLFSDTIVHDVRFEIQELI